MSARQFEENALYVEVFSSFVSQWFWVLAILKNILAVLTACCAFGNFMGRFETPKKILCGEKRERERERQNAALETYIRILIARQSLVGKKRQAWSGICKDKTRPAFSEQIYFQLLESDFAMVYYCCPTFVQYSIYVYTCNGTVWFLQQIGLDLVQVRNYTLVMLVKLFVGP